ncbi:CRISPR-associated endonuclease Cas1 [Trichococcus shcherbakoviae]|uniref:CRISPR-associated endonuclease Cas1 n=1 Tax=Trichococcus shcherbakoviae TaxID=2094020 RepID=UPI0029F56D81|nr:CRISPR-associated endonuclease Cas1 [Trichococcus shcherbakoviae]
MSTVYVINDCGKCGYQNGRLVVEVPEKRTEIPFEKVSGMLIIGNIQLSTQLMKACLKKGVVATFLSKYGEFYGKLQSTKHQHIERQRKQFMLSEEDDFSLALSKRFVKGKLNNQQVLLRRIFRDADNPTDASSDIMCNMGIYRDKIDEAHTIDELRGYEGIAARTYFDGISSSLSEEFRFNGRNRMPPKDPVNSLLSFGYTILMYEIYAAIEQNGLHPFCGFYHSDSLHHPTLASDLTEEWRPVIVDSLVLSLLHSKNLTMEHFYTVADKDGVYITDEGIKIFVQGFEHKMTTNTVYQENTGITYREALEKQAGDLWQAMREMSPETYKPFLLR